MLILRKLLRIFFWIVAVVLIGAGAAVWWLVYRPLPQISGTAPLPGLQKDASVDRDRWGVPHIRAGSLHDLAEAQGYVMAQDRLWQMDLLRRVARGELSEIVGPAALPLDKEFRTFRFGRAAERDLQLMDPESRGVTEAYAEGVNRFVEQHNGRLPIEFSMLHYKPAPWKPSDSLVIAAYMYETLTDTWEDELNRAKVTDRVGPERAKDLFAEDSPLDHFVVGDPDTSGADGEHSRSDPNGDDDDDMEPETDLKASLGGNPTDRLAGASFDLSSSLWPSIHEWLLASRRDIRQGLGSNNWVVSGDHTSTGLPLLANDTHLELTVPPIWYEAHLTAPGWNVKGFTLPGAPLVVIGHNDDIAWGFTNNGADVEDLYIETFNPAAPDEYRVHGNWVKAQTFDETIHVKDQPDVHFAVVVTRHGPVVRRDGDKGYALRWTATEPGGLAYTYNWLGRATNWDEFRHELQRVWGPAQNIVYADVDDNIGYIMAARVPIRKKGHGEVPVPGDTDDFEWTGYIPFERLPQVLNPESGLIVTANARVVGPKYKPYLTDRWEEPYRTERIYELLHEKHGLRPQDMLKIQTDTYSVPDVFLAQQLLGAAKSGQPEDERTKELIRQLRDWNGMADADSSIPSFLGATRRAAMRLILEPYLGKDAGLYSWRSMTFLQWVLSNRPSRWLPSKFKSYDDLLLTAADAAVSGLTTRTNERQIAGWRWKRFNSLEMLHPLGRSGLLKWLFSISGKPQSGTIYSVRAASNTHGPAMRFVADPGDWDDSIMLIPAGQSGQLGSSHYTDQFSYWYEGNAILSPFSDAAEANARKHTLTLQPAN